MTQQYIINRSDNRYGRKRSSHEIIRSSHSSKNAKNNLPQVHIDLNARKSKPLLIQKNPNSKTYHQNSMNNKITANIIKQTDGKRSIKQKKEDIHLKIMCNTQLVKKNKPDHQNSSDVLQEYRQEIQQLRLENQHLKEENYKLMQNQDYFQRQIKNLKFDLNEQKVQHRQIQNVLEKKVEEYADKIKKLYVQLINEKKKTIDNEAQENKMHPSSIPSHFQYSSVPKESTMNKFRGQIHSYRNNNRAEASNFNEQFESQKYQRLTSPESGNEHTRNLHVKSWNNNLDLKDHLKKMEDKGAEAYYKHQLQNKRFERIDTFKAFEDLSRNQQVLHQFS